MRIPPRQSAFPNACLYLTKNKQIEVVNESSKNLNQTKSIFQARVRKRAPSWGMHINVFDYTKGKGDKVIKEVIPFNGNKDDFNRYLKQLNK